jgi:hypothetical protein
MIKTKSPTSQRAANPQKQPKPVPPPGYTENQGEIALRMSHFFIRYLNGIYQAFEGDLALVIVLGEIAHHNVSRKFSSQGPLPPFKDKRYDDPNRYAKLEPCNAFSLAAATGIPRETVRRKIDHLVKRGWLKREAGGGLSMLPEVGKHFQPDFNLRLMLELLEVSEQLKAVLSAHAAKPAAPPSQNSARKRTR